MIGRKDPNRRGVREDEFEHFVNPVQRVAIMRQCEGIPLTEKNTELSQKDLNP
jgi:hypothetical protein